MIQRKILILLVVTFAVFLLVPQPQYSAAMTEQHDDAYYISLSAENKKLLNDLEGAIRAHDIRNAYALSDTDAFRSMVDEIPYPEWKGFVYFSPNGEAPVVVQRGSLNGSHTYSMDIFDGKDGEGCYLSGVQGGYVSYSLTIAQYSKGRANGAFQVLTIESEHSYSIAKTEGYTSDGLAYGCTKNTTKEGWVYYPYHFGWFDWWPDWPGMTLPPKPERGILNGIVIGIGTGMEPMGNRLGILLDGKEGVMWVDFYGRIDQFPVGTFVTVTDITTVAHAPTSPERFEINPVFPINLSPGIEVIVPKGFTLVFEQEANNAIQACFYDISGVFIVNKPLCIDKMTVRHGGVLTLNARLSSIGNAGHSEIVLENSSIVNGTYTWGLNQTKKGTHKFHLLDTVGDGITGEKHYGFWEYSYNTDGEWQGWNEIAQTNQAYYDRNNVKLDSEQARNYFLDPLGSGYGIREQNNDPDIISLAKKITAGIEGEYDKALAIHDWVANNIAYDYDYYYNVFYNTEGEHKWDGIINCPFTSKEILALGHTVCGGYTSLTNDLLRSVGLPARTFVFPSAPHSRTEVYVGDRWLMMDVTWDSKNVWEQGKLAATAPCTHTWFDISADDIDEYIMHQRFHYLPCLGFDIANGVLYGCGGRGTIVLPIDVKIIAPRAFEWSLGSAFESITAHEGLVAVDPNAFYYCATLKELIFPDSLKELSFQSFMGCYALEKLHIPAYDATVSGYFYSGGFAPGFTIYGTSPQIEQYAKDNRIRFVNTSPNDTVSLDASEKPTVTVYPTQSSIYINGKEASFEAYIIEGANYFRLRDLAYALRSTEKQFEVDYDDSTKAITLISGKAYTVVGGEMAQGDGRVKTATPTPSRIYIDGVELSFNVYNIAGSNFFKLRDFMEALNIFVGYDNSTNAISVDTSRR